MVYQLRALADKDHISLAHSVLAKVALGQPEILNHRPRGIHEPIQRPRFPFLQRRLRLLDIIPERVHLLAHLFLQNLLVELLARLLVRLGLTGPVDIGASTSPSGRFLRSDAEDIRNDFEGFFFPADIFEDVGEFEPGIEVGGLLLRD